MKTNFLSRMILSGILSVLALQTPAFAQISGPAHLVNGYNLVTDLLADPQNVNIYDADDALTDRIDWTGSPRTAISVCGSFMTMLMKHTYGLTDAQYTAKTGNLSPNAAQYHDAIVAQSGFTRVWTVTSMAPGDLLVFKYPSSQNSSGHVMMVQNAVPAFQDRTKTYQKFLKDGGEPNIAGFYDITVIDSSSTFHGANDTRATKPGGIGRNGAVRIFVDGSNNIVGYTWSTNGSDLRRVADGYSVAMGRYAAGW